MTREPLELEPTRSGASLGGLFSFLPSLFIYSYLFSHLIIVFDLLILFIITSFSSPVPPLVSWPGDRQGRAAPSQLPRSGGCTGRGAGPSPLRWGQGRPPEGGGLSFLLGFFLQGDCSWCRAGVARGLRTGEGQASRLPCLLRDKRNPSAHPCLRAYSTASENVRPGPSTSFSPGQRGGRFWGSACVGEVL